jgi:hypothetical protein
LGASIIIPYPFVALVTLGFLIVEIYLLVGEVNNGKAIQQISPGQVC